ncbi:MAG: hypothetical protein KAR19_19355 [Bacteroidales bacterium]|nr:hypothetical protein [Bacteroidales bacterium]
MKKLILLLLSITDEMKKAVLLIIGLFALIALGVAQVFVDTISEYTSEHGVLIDGTIIKDGAVYFAPSSPSSDTGVLYMNSSDEHIYFRSSTTTYDLTTGDSFDSTYSHLRIDSLRTEIEDTVSLGDVAVILTDTIPLFVFGGGGGNAGDTASFSTSTIYGSFYNAEKDTLVITEMIAVCQGNSPDITVDVEWHASLLDGSATGLNSVPPSITSITEGDSDVSFDYTDIPPGVWVWMKTPTIDTKPTYLSVTILGHKK